MDAVFTGSPLKHRRDIRQLDVTKVKASRNATVIIGLDTSSIGLTQEVGTLKDNCPAVQQSVPDDRLSSGLSGGQFEDLPAGVDLDIEKLMGAECRRSNEGLVLPAFG